VGLGVVNGQKTDDNNNNQDEVRRIHTALTEWLASLPGGYFNPKQEIRPVKMLDEAPGEEVFYGVFAKEFIAKGELLNQVPWEYIINDVEEDTTLAERDDEDGSLKCGTTRNLVKEMNRVETSKYGPYIRYLMKQPTGAIPSAWTENGKAMLEEVLGERNQKIPPEEATSWIEEDWLDGCHGDPGDDIGIKAAVVVITRADDELLVPVYDMYNHKNGKFYNTKMLVNRGVNHQVTARRDIQPGEQIHNSYNMCDYCGGRKDGYGTPEIFRDYGFVEDFPQRWDLRDLDVMFDLLKDENGEVVIDWSNGRMPKKVKDRNEAKRGLVKELKRLYKVRRMIWEHEWKDGKPSIPIDEWDSIWEYHQAIVNAISYALNSLADNDSERVPLTGKDGVCSAESCGGDHYDFLDNEPDDLQYNKPTCNNREILRFPDYFALEQLKTNYQVLNFAFRESDGDICMDLEDTLQICSCYRPHYHEFSAHFAARFIDTVKRVIFIGGGDSMLLHESLKYPSLEKVVGLELDQTVTRKAFKYFRTQPHFDDDRVEWWFGDATKSLLLLPKEYWGSFDLVLVDLSETVMAFSVTEDLDVFDALALLLKPDGVMVKNELYMEEMSETFDHTLQIYLEENPKICSQVMAFGSNRVDFFHTKVIDHNVETLLLPAVDKLTDRFEFFHDYRKNNAHDHGKCDLKSKKEQSQQQGNSAGILHVMDAENVTVALDGPAMEQMIYSVGKEEGFTPVSIPVKHPDGTSMNFVVVVFKEGYVLARIWKEYNYCALDVGVWGGFERAGSFQKRLAAELKAKTLSSFRVVVGGMYGSSTWQDDRDVIGPQIVQQRNCDLQEESDVEFSDTIAIWAAVDEATNLAASDNMVVGVVCGTKDKVDCIALAVLENSSKATKVVPIWTCPELTYDSGDTRNLAAMFECESKTFSAIQESLGGDAKMNMLVLDASTPLVMGQIIHSILNVPKYRDEILYDYNVLLSWSNKPKTEDWQRNFLERYRKDVRYDPITRVEMKLAAGEESMELGLVSCGDLAVFHNINILEKKLQKRLLREGSATKVEVVSISGGLYPFKFDYNPREFLQNDYDSEPGDRQYAEQTPLGREVILQLVVNEETANAAMPPMEGIRHSLESTLSRLNYVVTRFESYSGVGDGSLIVADFREGNIVLVWDGRDHIDLNLFLFDDQKELADSISSKFLNITENNLKVALRDDFPRGIGRAVNFKSDLAYRGIESITELKPYVD
jgi:spermidine synthase